MHVIGLAGVLMAALGLMSGTIRSSIPILIHRQLVRAWSFTYVALVTVSSAVQRPWKLELRPQPGSSG